MQSTYHEAPRAVRMGKWAKNLQRSQMARPTGTTAESRSLGLKRRSISRMPRATLLREREERQWGRRGMPLPSE